MGRWIVPSGLRNHQPTDLGSRFSNGVNALRSQCDQFARKEVELELQRGNCHMAFT